MTDGGCKESMLTVKVTRDQSDVMLALNAFALLPLHSVAEGRRQSIPSLLCDMTGLSKARISKGNLDDMRPSTMSRVQDHQQVWLAQQVADPAAFARVNSKIATAPRTQSGKHANWASWIHVLESSPEISLPISKMVGLAVDELLEQLMAACCADELVKFKQVLLKHVEHHGAAVRIADESAMEPATVADLLELQSIGNWKEANSFTRKLLDHLYLDMISCLDAEWSDGYFCCRQSLPLFPLVMVRPQNGLLERGQPFSRKNIFFKPVRQLLEFLYALVFYVRYRKWPASPPSPKTLADILYRPGSDELLDSSVVSSYFDGSTTLTVDLAYDHWFQLFQHFMPERKEGGRIIPPLPMIVLALQWQTLLVRDKGKSFLLLDQEKYDVLWRHRRQQLAVHQESRSINKLSTHRVEERIEWPSWMRYQSSSSS